MNHYILSHAINILKLTSLMGLTEMLLLLMNAGTSSGIPCLIISSLKHTHAISHVWESIESKQTTLTVYQPPSILVYLLKKEKKIITI